jgi:hypothetical protein
MSLDRIALSLAAVLLAGCGSDNGPSSTVTDLILEVQSAESEAARDLVVVGENASANLSALTDQGCISSVPCSTSAEVQLSSSDPAVLAPAQERVRTPAQVALVAHAPGSVTLTLSADGLTRSRRVDVTAEPLPLDAIQVTLVSQWNDLPVQYDPSHNLISVEIPDGEYAAFDAVALRNGTQVFGVPITASVYVSNPPITETTIGCRPTRVDIQCDVYSDLWIYGMMPGDDQIIVWARTSCDRADPACTWTSFTAHVVETPAAVRLDR